MSLFTQLLYHRWTEVLGWALLHFLWQGMLIAALLAIALLCLRRASANARYMTGLTALLLAALCPIGTAAWIGRTSDPQPTLNQTGRTETANRSAVTAEWDLPASSPVILHDELPMPPAKKLTPEAAKFADQTAALEPSNAAAAQSPAADLPAMGIALETSSLVSRLKPWLPWSVGLWFCGVALCSVRLMMVWIHVQRLRRVGVHPVAAPLADRFSPLCQRLGVRSSVQLIGSWCVDVPTVIGWMKPVILFPVSALGGLSPSQWEALLAHELAHIRRWDYAVNLGQTAIETMLFYHPAVWWISRRIRAERENCCDDVAASVTNDEIGYVRALLHIAETSVAKNRIAIAASDGDLLSRAKRLLTDSPQTRFAPGSGGVLLTTVVLGVLAAGLFRAAWAVPDTPVSAKGYQPQTVSPISAGKQGLKVVLRKPGEATGVTKANEAPPTVFLCDVLDEADGKPIPNVNLKWRIQHKDTREQIWQQEYTTNMQGQYEVRLPQSVMENAGYYVNLVTEHQDYLPIRDSGFRIRQTKDARIRLEDFLQHLKLERGKEVTGRFVLPDGSPAKDMTVMIGDNRDGLEDGLGIGYYTQTDAEGKFRLLTLPRWPQRISWFPQKHAANSKAITETFGDQGTIRISPGFKLMGKIVTHEGQPMPKVFVRATTGTRVPRRYAETNAQGEFTFDPLPRGKYELRVVRSVQDHHNHGEWRQVPLAVPIPNQIYDLEPAAEPVVIRAPSTVRIRVRVLDGAGKPLSNERLAIGQTADYRNALIAAPVAGQPGEYEFLYPQGEYIRDLVLQHSFDEMAFYQEAGDKPAIPGSMLVLGKADEDMTGITIHLRQAGLVQLRIKTDAGGPMPANTNISTSYVNSYPDSNVRFGDGVVQFRSPKGPWSSELKQIAPDEPLKIEIQAPGFQPASETVLLADGETKTLEVTLTPSDD